MPTEYINWKSGKKHIVSTEDSASSSEDEYIRARHILRAKRRKELTAGYNSHFSRHLQHKYTTKRLLTNYNTHTSEMQSLGMIGTINQPREEGVEQNGREGPYRPTLTEVRSHIMDSVYESKKFYSTKYKSLLAAGFSYKGKTVSWDWDKWEQDRKADPSSMLPLKVCGLSIINLWAINNVVNYNCSRHVSFSLVIDSIRIPSRDEVENLQTSIAHNPNNLSVDQIMSRIRLFIRTFANIGVYRRKNSTLVSRNINLPKSKHAEWRRWNREHPFDNDDTPPEPVVEFPPMFERDMIISSSGGYIPITSIYRRLVEENGILYRSDEKAYEGFINSGGLERERYEQGRRNVRYVRYYTDDTIDTTNL